MKKYLHLIAIIAVLGIGAVLGGTALSTQAQSSLWTAPTAPPPGGNVAAPINIGGGEVGSTYSQTKTGLLGLNDVIVKKLQILTAEGTTTSTLGQVLTAIDGNGTTGWRTPTGGGGTCSDTVPYQDNMISDHDYTNGSGRQLIIVAAGTQSSVSGQQFLIGYIGASSADTIVSKHGFYSDNVASVTFVVPPGYHYKVKNESSNGPTLHSQAWRVCGGSTGGGTSITGGSCPTGQAVSAIDTAGAVSCTTSPNIRDVSCTTSGFQVCNMVCTSNEHITYTSGCNSTNYTNAYTLSCTRNSAGTGLATCTAN